MHDSNNRGSLYFMVSTPQAGKSTFAWKWLNRMDFDTEQADVKASFFRETRVKRPRVIVAGDDFRKAIHGHSFIPDAEGLVFAHMDVACKALLIRGFDVLVDETSTTECTILRYLRIDLSATPIWIDTPVEVCKQRAIAAGKPYLLGPIDRMAKQLEELKKDWPHNFERLKAYLRQRAKDDVVAT